MLLSELEICKASGNSIFRIRLFDVDSANGKPSTELTDTLIDINSNKKKITLNLESHNITIPNKNFFIAIEWLQIESNSFTKKIKYGGSINLITFYEPGIGVRYNKDKTDSKKLWNLNYNGTWQEQKLNSNMNLLISAKLK
jgi:hypothetical protein